MLVCFLSTFLSCLSCLAWFGSHYLTYILVVGNYKSNSSNSIDLKNIHYPVENILVYNFYDFMCRMSQSMGITAGSYFCVKNQFITPSLINYWDDSIILTTFLICTERCFVIIVVFVYSQLIVFLYVDTHRSFVYKSTRCIKNCN